MNAISRLLSILTILVVLILPAAAPAQVCGDLDGNGSADMGDWVLFVNHLLGNVTLSPDNFEFDERYGNTAGDAWLWINILESNRSWAPCNPTMDYSFTLNRKDTVYVPYRSYIPNERTEISLPVASTVDDSACTYYLPLLVNAAGSNGTFEFTDVSQELPGGLHGGTLTGDTAILFGTEWEISYRDNQILAWLHYSRTGSGEGSVYTELVNRDWPLLYTVGWMLGPLAVDLYQPVVVPVDLSYPMGDCNCDMYLDISDITCFVQWMFEHWPRSCEPYLQPYGVLITDMDCSGNVDISDLVYFVDYIFLGGPPPCNPLGV